MRSDCINSTSAARPMPFIYLNKFIRAHMAGVSPACCFSFDVCANCINMPRGLTGLLMQRTISDLHRVCAVAISKQGMILLRLAVSGPMITWSHLDSEIVEAPPKSRDRRKDSAKGICPPHLSSNSRKHQILSPTPSLLGLCCRANGQAQGWVLATSRAECSCQAVLDSCQQ